MIRLIIEYIFITTLFGDINVANISYKYSQTTSIKPKTTLIFRWREYIPSWTNHWNRVDLVRCIPPPRWEDETDSMMVAVSSAGPFLLNYASSSFLRPFFLEKVGGALSFSLAIGIT